MPKANNTLKPKPWYKNINNWAWHVSGLCVLGIIIIMVLDGAEEKRSQASQYMPSSYQGIFTPEECVKMGIGKKTGDPGDWKPDPDGARKFHEFIEKRGNADPAQDAIQDADYHDLLDQNGGPEGF